MSPSSPDTGERLPRFSRGERWAHRVLGMSLAVCMVTGAILYVDALSVAVGRRELVSLVHFVSGVIVPVPLLAASALSAAFRSDARRLNRFREVDWEWLRRSDRRTAGLAVGKFNAGQKLNAAFTAGAVVIMLLTGLVMRYFSVFPDDVRTGATFVHDLVALAFVVVALGHIVMALRDPEARRGMRRGTVAGEWAAVEHPLWAAEVRSGGSSSQPPPPA